MNYIRNCGVEDILITCNDNRTGFPVATVTLERFYDK